MYIWDLYTFNIKCSMKVESDIVSLCVTDTLPILVLGESKNTISIWNITSTETLKEPLCVLHLIDFGIQNSLPIILR